MDKKLVYFLCTGNSCRSQIADGFLKALGSEKYEVKSAGLEAHGLNPRAVATMQEAGIDISNNTSDVIDPDLLSQADYIITLCGHANDNCPAPRNDKAERWHWGFDDPAKATGTEEEITAKFREVRDAIKLRITQFLKDDNHDLASSTPKNYQALVEDRIYFGGAADVEDMVKNEGIDVIVDLRGEATQCAYPDGEVQWIQVALGDNAAGPQDQLFQQAIHHVVEAYQSGKKVGFHCAGGGGRTGAVAVGTLITLGKSQTIAEAEAIAKSIRDKVNIKPAQREAIEKLFKA